MPRGGKRLGAGRPKGPAKTALNTKVLPGTFNYVNGEGFRRGVSNGEVLDDLVKKIQEPKTKIKNGKLTTTKH